MGIMGLWVESPHDWKVGIEQNEVWTDNQFKFFVMLLTVFTCMNSRKVNVRFIVTYTHKHTTTYSVNYSMHLTHPS